MNEIKIVTYNILADYLNSHEYVLVNKKYLDNEFRIKLLTKKFKKLLTDYNKTIFCIQEIGPTQLSYLYVWFQKFNSNCISFNGLAIFYPIKFEIISAETNYINKINFIDSIKDKNLVESLNDFKHSYILLRIKSKYFKEVTLCTTHLVANPKYDDIKILQTYLLAKNLEKYKRVILCGDFNSMPDSSVYNLLNNGKGKLSNQKELKIKNKLTSSFKLLYNDEINITTHASNKSTPIFTETIDYIWSSSNLIPVESSKVRTLENIKKSYGTDYLPNKVEPSDHFYLSIKYKF